MPDAAGAGRGDDADYAQVKAWFLDVVDLPDDGARQARLQALGAPPALAARVLALVDHDRARTQFAAPVQALAADAAGPELKVGERVGAWTLTAELGQGGMGAVFLAERSDGHYRQTAALKLLRGWSGEAALARLARERQILASLQHPHIAALIDGGATPAGQPYLVMAQVEGQPLDQWCRAHRLGIDGVLALLLQVCDAVAYAHRQLVVHCDLKPANILVGADGRAMLLDFGIAQLQDDTAAEADGSLALTPAYASPEQRAGQSATPASDVYALGRVLAELLGAITPPPPRAREWRAIVARATADRPADRYADVPALAEDLRRFLAQRPLGALPASPAYRAAKALRRHWAGALALSTLVALSAAFVWRLAAERDRAQLAEAQARDEAARTRQVADFLVSLFEGADPRRGGRPGRTAAELLAEGRERVASGLQGQPALRAVITGVLAEVHESIGQPRQAITLYREALALEQALPQPDPLREAALLNRLAVTLANNSEAEEARTLAQRSLALRQARLPDADPRIADAYNTLGLVLARSGPHDEAERALREALRRREADPAVNAEERAATRHNLGLLYLGMGRHAEAEQALRRALADKQRLYAPTHPSTMMSQQLLAMALARQQRGDEAQALLRTLVERRREVFGQNSADVESALNELGSVLQDAGRAEEAVAAYREALAIAERVRLPRSPELAVVVNNLGTALEDLGDPSAERQYRDSLAMRRAVLPAQHLTVARAEHNLGRWLLRAGRLAEAAPLLAQAEASRSARLPPGHDQRLDSALRRAELALRQGRRADAEAALDEVAAHAEGLSPLRRADLLQLRALAAATSGDRAAAQRWHTEALALARARLGAAHPATRRIATWHPDRP